MSSESSTWLNTMTLIGQTDKRGNAWHYRAEEQGAESNHYNGFIPVADVKRRLFNFEAEGRPLFLADGQRVATHKALVSSDENAIMSIVGNGYKIHNYDEWLVNNVERLLGENVGISSAGLLKNRNVAWVECSVPESIDAGGTGVMFRPNLLASTSLDGSLATSYRRTVQLVVCDNTLSAALNEGTDQELKVRHTKNSETLFQIRAADALGLIEQLAMSASADIERLTQLEVSEKEWKLLLDAMVPQEGTEGRAATQATMKREALETHYKRDGRNSWSGTAFGALQAFNLWSHHTQNLHGEEQGRGARNAWRAVNGETDRNDRKVLKALHTIKG